MLTFPAETRNGDRPTGKQIADHLRQDPAPRRPHRVEPQRSLRGEGNVSATAGSVLEEQDAIAPQILETLQDEDERERRLATRRGKLRELAEEALAEHRRGETRPLDELL